nr:DUF418 domain-containing protein [Paenibacillus ginsengarvi]
MGPSKERIIAYDFARALAIFGMIIVNYKLAMQTEHDAAAWLQSIAGMFEGRASALFVVLAGIGVTLMTSNTRKSMSKELIHQCRNSLCRRAAFLFVAGPALLGIGWNADILHYYAVFMLAAAVLVTASDKTLLCLFAIVLVTSQVCLLVFDYSKGWESSFKAYTDLWTPEGFARNLVFNGFHPVFPWLGFFLFGMWLGRKRWPDKANRSKLLLISLFGLVFLEILSYLLSIWSSAVLDDEATRYFFGTKPMPPNMLYVLSGISSAVFAIAICSSIVEHYKDALLTRAVIHTGQLSLSHYIGHIVIGLGILETAGYLENGKLSFSMAYGTVYFIIAIVFSYWWRKGMKRGPIESIMRKLC